MRPHLKSFVDHANDMSCNNIAEFLLISLKKNQFHFSTSNRSGQSAVVAPQLLYGISLELDLTDERRCDILANLGFYYLEFDLRQDALSFLREAYHMTEGKSEKEWLSLRCRISFILAKTYYRMDNVELGIEMMKTSIDLAKKVYIEEEDKVMERFLFLAMFYNTTWSKFWKLKEVAEEAQEFFLSCTPGRENLNRARCLANLSCVYGFYGLILINSWQRQTLLKLVETVSNKSLNMFERLLGAHVSMYPRYYVFLAQSAIVKLEINPTEARTQLDKALGYCIQNGDRHSYSWMASYKKYIFDNSTWWQSFFYCIRNVIIGRLLFAWLINQLDGFSKERDCGKILFLKIRNCMNKEKALMICYNYVILVLLFIFLF